jgi:hypothetical protein
MTAETETGHPGLNSWMDMMMMMNFIILENVLSKFEQNTQRASETSF